MQRGFTLVEMLVVLVLLGLAAALVAPAILPSHHTDASELSGLLAASRDAALRRGEVLWLRVESSGAWRIDGDASSAEGAVATGQLATPVSGAGFTVMISPLGSCAFDVRSGAAARAIPLDPLTCEVRAS